MENLALIDSFSDFKDEKLIDRVTLMVILEEVFRNTLKRKYGSDENFDIIINPEKGDLEIWRNREIVKDGEVERLDAPAAARAGHVFDVVAQLPRTRGGGPQRGLGRCSSARGGHLGLRGRPLAPFRQESARNRQPGHTFVETTSGAHHQHQQDAARANKPCQATSA